MPHKGKGVTRHPFIKIAVGWGAIISGLVGWLVGAVVLLIVVAGSLALLPTAPVSAAPEEAAPLECLSCHPKKLEFHDKLGSGNKACWVCHDSTDMKMLRLADETRLSLSDSPQLCAQCHQKRYDAWQEGTHGIPGPSTEKCTTCHNPHQPQVAFSNITKPHPPVQPPPAQPSVELLVILGITLLLMIGVVAAVVRKGEWL